MILGSGKGLSLRLMRTNRNSHFCPRWAYLRLATTRRNYMAVLGPLTTSFHHIDHIFATEASGPCRLNASLIVKMREKHVRISRQALGYLL